MSRKIRFFFIHSCRFTTNPRVIMKKRTLIALSGQLLVACTIIIATLILTNTFKQIKFGNGKIDVKGCAEREIISDFVKLESSISTTAGTLLEAYEQLEKDQEILQKYLKEQSIPSKDIAFSSIKTCSVYEQNQKGFSTNKIESYQLYQDFIITSTDVPLVTKLSQDITSLIKDGLSITSFPPSYFYLKIDELKITMLDEASKNAYQRAEALVAQSGAKVGRLISAHQGVFQITPASSTSVSDYGENDTSSIAKRIKAVVTMEYEIR